jgi:hypothetical protein
MDTRIEELDPTVAQKTRAKQLNVDFRTDIILNSILFRRQTHKLKKFHGKVL